MFYSSTWQITLAGTRVLSFGDLLEAQPDIVPQRVVQQTKPLRAAFGVQIPRGNVTHSISFTRIVPYDSHADACIGEIAALIALPTGQGPAVLEILGGASVATLANACLAPGSGRCRVDAQILFQSFQIVGGELTLAAAIITNQDDEEILNQSGIAITTE